jgi:hypothetical protein
MNDTNKLLKIINKAISNGFDFCKWQYENTTIPLYGLMEGNINQLIKTNYYKLLLLDKEFAKCFYTNITFLPPVKTLENLLSLQNNNIDDIRYVKSEEATYYWTGGSWIICQNICSR